MLTELTKEQHDQMKPWAQKWIKRSLDCTPADRAVFEDGCARCYEYAKLKWHNNVIWVDNPVEATITATRKMQYILDPDSTEEDYKRSLKNNRLSYISGGLRLSYAAWESFFHEVCHLKTGYEGHARAYRDTMVAGLWYPHTDFVVVCERPLEIHQKRIGEDGWNSHVLHNEDGAALKYKGLDIWYIEGSQCDKQIVMEPETQTLDQLNSETNADLKEIRIRRYGWVKYIQESGFECVDTRLNAIEGTKEALYKVEDTLRFVAVCPTGRVFSMGVPSDQSIVTCEKASNWLQGDNPFRILGRT